MAGRARIQPVIMSGGAGTRLWPLSRNARPKQFLPLATELSLFQETAQRVAAAEAAGYEAPAVIAGPGHVGHIAAQLAALGVAPAAIIVEPCPRNTAAVAAVAAVWSEARNPDALVLLAPADHHVADAKGFREAVAKGAEAARSGAIVTFGIRPAEPHTGYGYIERGKEIAPSVFRVAAFREKPDRAVAERYVAGGAHYWNAGIFLFSPRTMLEELERYAPAIKAAAVKSLASARRNGSRLDLDAAAFAASPAEAVDRAIMEKTDRAAVVAPVDVGWTDIGAWSSIAGGDGHPSVALVDSRNCIVKTDGPFVGAIGVDDLVIVATGDAVLVARKDRAQDVRKIVEELKARGREDLL